MDKQAKTVLISVGIGFALGLMVHMTQTIEQSHRIRKLQLAAWRQYYDGAYDAFHGEITRDEAADGEMDLKAMPEMFMTDKYLIEGKTIEQIADSEERVK